jgi:hypothetical protein
MAGDDLGYRAPKTRLVWTSDARGKTKLSGKVAQAAQPDRWAARNFNNPMLKEVMCIYIWGFSKFKC